MSLVTMIFDTPPVDWVPFHTLTLHKEHYITGQHHTKPLLTALNAEMVYMTTLHYDHFAYSAEGDNSQHIPLHFGCTPATICSLYMQFWY